MLKDYSKGACELVTSDISVTKGNVTEAGKIVVIWY